MNHSLLNSEFFIDIVENRLFKSEASAACGLASRPPPSSAEVLTVTLQMPLGIMRQSLVRGFQLEVLAVLTVGFKLHPKVKASQKSCFELLLNSNSFLTLALRPVDIVYHSVYKV